MNNDLISREALKKDLKQYFTDGVLDGVSARLAFDQILHDIDNAPTVFDDKAYSDGYMQGTCDCEHAHERPQGEWIRKVDEAGFISHICSECGAEIEVEDCSDDKFCFNCGAKMRGEENV